MTVQIPALATPVPQSTDPVNFAARADAFLASLVPFAEAANRQNVENNQLNDSTALAAGVAQSASAAAMAALGAPRFDPALNYQAGNQVWSPVDAKVYRRLVAGRSAVDPSADPANWKIHMQTKADLGLGNVDNTSDANKPVSLLQKAALDAKETPAGALAQMQGFGLGAVVAPVIADADALRAGGVYQISVAASSAAGLPLALGHSLLHLPGTGGFGHQIASPLTTVVANANRVWHRQLSSAGWSLWQELAYLNSPALTGDPTAPTPAATDSSGRVQTTAGSLAQMQQLFGLGVADSSGPASPDLDAAGTASGIYRVSTGTAGTKPANAPSTTTVEEVRYNATNTRQLMHGAGASDAAQQMWARNKSGASVTPWRQFAFLDSSFPNIKIGNVASADVNSFDFSEKKGVWTPSLVAVSGSITLSAAVGSYTRLVDRCLWNARLQVSAINGATGLLRLLGLPWNVIANSRAFGGATIGFITGLSGSVGHVTCIHLTNSASLQFYKRGPTDAASSSLVAEDITTQFQIYLQGQYEI